MCIANRSPRSGKPVGSAPIAAVIIGEIRPIPGKVYRLSPLFSYSGVRTGPFPADANATPHLYGGEARSAPSWYCGANLQLGFRAQLMRERQFRLLQMSPP